MKAKLKLKKPHIIITAIFLVIAFVVVGAGGCEAMSCGCGALLLQHDLVTDSTAGGSVSTPGEGTFSYDADTVVPLVAVADDCYEFVYWTGDTVASPNSATTTITMDEAKSVTANFELLSYSASVNSTDGGEVTTPGEGTFTHDCGSTVNLVATPDAYYGFAEWTGEVSAIANVYDESTTITVNGDYSITANFCLFSGGNGTIENPYQVADWWHLDNVRNYLSSYFVVINDLDSNSIGYTELASEAADEGKGWQPIGTILGDAKFTGEFDGQGYEIRDLFISRPDESNIGLFGVINEDGVVENVKAVNGNVTGQEDVGGLVGKNEGTVNNSYATNSVTGDDYVGGLTGKNEGTVNNSYATGIITGSTRVGGLVGQNSNNISNSYATGSVTGGDYVGGLTGRNEGPVSNSYSTGNVTGTDDVGGLVGKNEDTVSNSFWDTQTSGQVSSSGGTGKTTTEMQDVTTFSGASWDIIAVSDPGDRNTGYIWNIVDDETYPFLSWQS